ncbi:VOC family protein [Nocardioides sp. HB32]
MVAWQLTVDARDPGRLMAFWAPILDYEPTDPDDPYVHRIVDPTGCGPPIWFQQVPEPKTGKSRIHLDIYPTGQDRTLPLPERKRVVDARVVELIAAGAAVVERIAEPDDYHVVMLDPEGNEFCVG